MVQEVISWSFPRTALTFPRVRVSSRVTETSRVRATSRVRIFARVRVTSRVRVRAFSRVRVTSRVKVRVRVRDSYHPYGGLGACPRVRVRVRSQIRVRATRGDGRARGPRGCRRVLSSRSVRHLPAASRLACRA